MALPAQNDRMFPIACLLSQTQMRRSLVGAVATDPVVAERRPRTRRPTRQTTPANAGARTA